MMEITAKSVLKKSNSSNTSLKKVSFSDTVKLYIDDPSKISNFENEIAKMKWVEISIVDKSYDVPFLDSSYEDCKVSDFLVHKVVYDGILPDDDNELEIQNEDIEPECFVFESPADEGLEFVVHKVTEHEDESALKELESDNFVSEEGEHESTFDVEVDGDVKGLSELSVKNILEHDKIIAFIDQKSLCLPSLHNTLHILEKSNKTESIKNSPINCSTEKNARIGLSPPLQELSLDNIVKAHSDNILAELDISPLNSVQETDSDSDLSSEGTMIMMTTEECERNERHIQESLLKYQSLKEKESKTTLSLKADNAYDANSGVSIDTHTICESINNLSSELETRLSCGLDCNDEESHSSESNDVDHRFSVTDDVDIESSQLSSCLEQCSLDSMAEPPPPKDCRSLSLTDMEVLQSMCESSILHCSNSPRKGSVGSNIDFWDKSLTSVEIPKDVREWKILLNSFEKNFQNRLNYQNESSVKLQFEEHSSTEKEVFCDESDSSDSQSSLSQINTEHCDELEQFVNQNTERVERIRKRYLPKNKNHSFQYTPNRGTRPQFGSTAQILHLMQKQNNPPFYTYSGTKNHMSWPCDDLTSDSELEKNVKFRHSPHMYVSQSLSSDCSSQSSFDSDEHINSLNGDHLSISSCSSLLMQERGRPEGASPPKPGVNDSFEHSYDETPDGYVYYSMKV